MKPVINGSLQRWIVRHLTEYIQSGGRKGHMWDSRPVGGDKVVPTLLLTTIGRKSGKPSTIPLIYVQDDKSFVVVGSRGGAPEHPHWYLNLMSEGKGWIQVAQEHSGIVPELIEGTDRESIWNELVELFPPYRDYEAQSEGVREIPVIRLVPT
ncbi:MAG: nitroreductase family deazaflavin-dependent oxidoreductase [Gammaproteobacteria bacterium]|nr:nitroreductase family deazaflavin-dependent oxidoreductase [Gammaproteobacteria bacterium]